MTRWVALLRAVNLGARNRVPMPELRALLEARGHGAVRTYIASGNVLLDTRSRSRRRVAAELEELVAGLAELGDDLGGGEVADFFGSHGGHSPGYQTAAPSRTMNRQRKGSLASARRKASLATVAGIPASSKRTAPGLITAT